MLIAQGVAVLPISAPIMGRTDTVFPAIIWDDRDIVLIDTGFPRQLDSLRSSVSQLGIRLDAVNRIIVTHQDIDHIGNLEQLVQESASQPEVAAHELEKPYIQGEKRLLRFTDEAIAQVERMPSHVPESFKQALKGLMLRPPQARVDRTVEDGDVLPWCGGIVVIGTPGHTPGHISLYHPQSRTLFAGDALAAQDGKLLGVDPATALDLPAAQASLRKLIGYEIDTIVCYHGGLCDNEVMEQLRALASPER